jgi:hypothetical protein
MADGGIEPDQVDFPTAGERYAFLFWF